jgi:hypothetical protein
VRWVGVVMNRVLLSLCLLGAALATANTLFLQGRTCRPPANEAVALNSPRNIAPPPGKGETLGVAKNRSAAAASPDFTGSIETMASAAKPSKIENHGSEWAEVTTAVKVRGGPSISAPILRYYRAGATLRVIERQTDWAKIVDPATSKDGWIYARYLSSRDKPSQAQVSPWQDPPLAELRARRWWYEAQQGPRFSITFGARPRW